MKRKAFIITIIALLVISFAFAGRFQRNYPGFRGQGMNYQDCQILTEEEQVKVQEARLKFEKKAIPLRADIRVLRMEMNELILAGKSSKEISGKLSKLNDTRATLASIKLNQQIEVRSIVGEDNYRKMGMRYKSMMQSGRKGYYRQGGNMMGGRGYDNDSYHWNILRNGK
ncbi:MAG: hypothetical protein KAT14_05940 [Candidatus Marinimicrobia bacterium]|nr:hypothetical protein [Candidatus Neomarinimicrobiota bacterium]